MPGPPSRGSAAAHLDKRRAARSRQRRERTPNPNSAMSFARQGFANSFGGFRHIFQGLAP